MRIFKLKRAVLLSLAALVAMPGMADEQAVAELDAKVNARVQQLEEAGFLPTYQEIEMIKIDIVDAEIQLSGISAAEAVEKYQLTPMIERSVKMKETMRLQGFSTGVVHDIPPPPPPPN